MFLKSTIKRNKALIEFAKNSILNGDIYPNSYVIDLDSVVANAKMLKTEADKFGITLFQMTKQFGRNPLIANAIKNAGIKKAVCVDFQEAIVMQKANIEIGNLGHLVQVPNNLMNHFLKSGIEVMTIFSLKKAELVSVEAEKIGITQDIILRVYEEGDVIYDGQDAGFNISELDNVLSAMKKLKNIRVVGFTSFPTFLYDGTKTSPTKNLETIKKAINIAEDMGMKITHINTPSANSVSTLKSLHEFGSTFAEPGHALTGTMPSNAYMDEPEIPSIVYASEVSHIFKDKAFFYGGGFYPRGKFENILVYKDNQEPTKHQINQFPPSSIDYYLNFNANPKDNIEPGDVVIGAFRTQIFVTRSMVVVVKGLSNNKPEIVGKFNSQGDELSWK